jgi:hypothetical protein
VGIRPSSSGLIDVTVATSAGRTHRDGIRVHRSRTVAPADADEHEGIPTTSVARTQLDIAGLLAPGPLERAVERSLALRLFDLQDLDRVIAANRRRPGATALARIVGTMHDEPQLSRSQLEDLMRDLCDANAIPRPREGRAPDDARLPRRAVHAPSGGVRAAVRGEDPASAARFSLIGHEIGEHARRGGGGDLVR